MLLKKLSLSCLCKENPLNLLEYALAICCVFSGAYLLLNHLYAWNLEKFSDQVLPLDLNHVPEIALPGEMEESRPADRSCRLWNCLNLYRCGSNGRDRLTVYVYPLQKYVDAESGQQAAVLTREYYQIIEAVVGSHHYSDNPNEACLFLSTIDVLNENLVVPRLVNRALANSLAFWERGENHIVFNMLSSGRLPNLNSNSTGAINTDRAIILGGGLSRLTYRADFDVALPVWSPALQYLDVASSASMPPPFPRKYMLVAAQLNAFPEQLRQIQTLAADQPDKVLPLHACAHNNSTAVRCSAHGVDSSLYPYPSVLGSGSFCLLTRSIHLGLPDFLEMLAYNCIPVVAVDDLVLPFEDVLDWSLAAIRIRESELHAIMQKLSAVSAMKVLELQLHGRWLFQRYFKDLKTITLTALQILEDRIFPHRARSVSQWNTLDNYRSDCNPLFLPLIAKPKGFTAVILTYDRVESLFTLISKLSVVPSLYSILVIWNNQQKAPPPLSTFPLGSKPLKVIQTRANKLSNRFFPYAEIETEAILTIDDDIIMLTADELDFGFEVWREFPDRIVGFPSRIHVWNNESMHWQYDSEWTNQISMVLTGASFHHKIWSHLYTYTMPAEIKSWVDEHMNCEDIAMNFLVANVTKKAPIKVTPRKKFKCPECTNTEMLSADEHHMRERSSCIENFAKIYGHMPLRSVEFRADPVLFKDNFPEKLKRFNDVGIL